MSTINLKISNEEIQGLKRVQEVLTRYRNKRVKVGVFGGSYPNGESIAEVGYLHEFGSESKRTFMYKGKKITISGVPTRSFLRVPIKKLFSTSKGVMKDLTALRLVEEFQNGYTGKTYNYIASACVDASKEAFATQGDGTWERNINEKYIELKGSDIPLIDTGMLVSSITSKIEEKQ